MGEAWEVALLAPLICHRAKLGEYPKKSCFAAVCVVHPTQSSRCQASWNRTPDFPHMAFANHLLSQPVVNGVNPFYFALQRIKVALRVSQLPERDLQQDNELLNYHKEPPHA